MCLTCGCMLPHDDHGNPEYLTMEDLEKMRTSKRVPRPTA